MGLYRIPVRPEKVEAIPKLMESIGFPVIRIEKEADATCYLCANPKRSNKTWSFRIAQDKEDHAPFFMCGLSQVSKRIVKSLNVEGLFIRNKLT